MNNLICSFMILFTSLFQQSSFERAKNYFSEGSYEQAIELLKALVDNNAEDTESRFYLGKSYLMTGEIDKAFEHLEIAKDQDPKDAEKQYWYGFSCVQKLRQDGVSTFKKIRLSSSSRRAFEKAVALDGNNLDAREGLARYYFNAPMIAGGSDSKAMQQVEFIKERDVVKGNLLMADLYFDDEEYTKAEEECRHLIAIGEGKDKAYHLLGVIYDATKRYEKALDAFQHAIESNPDQAISYYQYGRTSVIAQDNLEQGVSYLEAYTAMEIPKGSDLPKKEYAYWRLGMAYQLNNEPDKARKAYLTALEIHPNLERAQKALKSLESH